VRRGSRDSERRVSCDNIGVVVMLGFGMSERWCDGRGLDAAVRRVVPAAVGSGRVSIFRRTNQNSTSRTISFHINSFQHLASYNT
jgi:hypothetical protein